MKKIFLNLLLTTFLGACSSLHFNTPKLKATTIYPLNTAPTIGHTLSDQNIKLGGFSSIHFLENKNNDLYFHAILNRGPTLKSQSNELIFLLPDFNPKILTIKADGNTQELSVITELDLKNGKQKTSGLPINRVEENPVDVYGLFYSIDPHGLDLRAIVNDNENGWWLADQYAPSLVQVNIDGDLTQKLIPNAGLPRMYSNKLTHQGFSALAKIGPRLLGFIPDFEQALLYRILEVSSDSMRSTAEFFYQLDAPLNKIVAASALDLNKVLVLEKSDDETFRKIFLIEINKSEELVKKHLLLDINDTTIKSLKNISSFTLVDMKTLALITDNNYQIDGQTDFKTGRTPLNKELSQLVIFEFEDNIIK